MANVDAYPVHGGQLRQISERFGIPVSDLLDFSANINPSGPPPAAVSALRASLDDLTTLTEYPDMEQLDLRQALAHYAGTDARNVMVANGFVPLLDAALRVLKIRRCLLPVPAFVEYRKALERAGVTIVPHELDSDASFRYDPEAMLAGEEEAILLANPQNPSGVWHEFAPLRDLVTRASKKSMYVLLDEAFIDYVPEHSLVSLVEQFPKLILFRSVTKFHGIPGLRVAYALANPELSRSITENLPPWPITTLASRAVMAALDDHVYVVHSIAENLARRDALKEALESCGLRVYPSAANFILFQLPFAINPDPFWRQMIAEHSIVLRSCANYEGLPKGHFRAAIRTQGENARLIQAIASTLCELLPT